MALHRPRKENILRLDVAVQDGVLVQVGHRARHLHGFIVWGGGGYLILYYFIALVAFW